MAPWESAEVLGPRPFDKLPILALLLNRPRGGADNGAPVFPEDR